MTDRAAGATDLGRRLVELTIADERRLRRQWDRARRQRDAEARGRAIADVTRRIEQAEQRIERRRRAVPALTYPADLPVSGAVDQLARAIADHQVIVVAGETGSGKSTQLPKICLQIGRGVRGMIGHTQPRRIAARALAERISEETGTRLGGAIGYTIRFGDHTGPDTLVKLMTDGILLADIARDRMLRAYDTIILDEAHERSLNIDFLLGYLVELLPRRPDLKLIITSATIDPARFARHFGDAPVVEVSGRTYPVEIRYRPYGPDGAEGDEADATADGDDRRGDPDRRDAVLVETGDQSQAITAAVDELMSAGQGDILVFLSGEREITDTADVLRGHLAGRRERVDVLPLYGRLSSADQHKVFDPHTGRRIVLSTNVAETSLTVPGIRYVIDPGTARISRYSPRTKVQRLPIERISQASAGQRAGRCGRLEDGVCIRLYSQADFEARPRFTDPEIARTALASVILRMAALELGDIQTFPFLDPPDGRQITDGVTVLTELGAIEQRPDRAVTLTPTGRSVAALPVDPRLARMIVEGDRQGCLAEMLVIASALAIVDVREYPLEERDKATAAHSRFVDPRSDFVAFVSLWRYLAERGEALSGNAFRRMCRSEYLHYLRIREWQDLHAQLRQLVRGLGMTLSGELGAAPEREAGTREASATQAGRGSLAVDVDRRRVHAAALSGLLSHVGLRVEQGREYQGARGSRFVLWPGSALARSGAPLVVAAELVETSRLWGRICAAVEPEWVEEVGAHLLRRSYSEPRWQARRASVMATEKVTLLGVTIVGARPVQYDRIDPELARELFIRHALVERDWQSRHRFLADNDAAIQQVEDWENRTRRRDIVVDDDTLFDLYQARIPADVTSGRHFDAWWKTASRTDPGLLTFTADQLIAAGAKRWDDSQLTESFPDTFRTGDLDLPLDYVFEPGQRDDGVTVTIPLAVLARVDPAAFERQIPGLRRDLVIALIRSLPKTLRRNFVPVPDVAEIALRRMESNPPTGGSSLPAQLAAALTAASGVVVRTDDFDLAKVPDHLRMNFAVVDATGSAVASGKDLPALQRSLRADSRDAIARMAHGVERSGLLAFPAEGLPRQVDATVDGQAVRGYPALVDEQTSVGVRVYGSADEQSRSMRAGTRRLLVLRSPPPMAMLKGRLTRDQLLVLSTARHGTTAELAADATLAAIDALLDWAGGPAWTADGFAALARRIEPELPRAVRDVMAAGVSAVRAGNAAERAIEAAEPVAGADQLTDMRRQLAETLAPGFLDRVGARHLPDVERWLRALQVRADRVRDNPVRDRERMAEVAALRADIEAAIDALPAERRTDDDVAGLRRLLEEYRVAVFAQPMRTAVPVSAKRIRTAIAALRRDA